MLSWFLKPCRPDHVEEKDEEGDDLLLEVEDEVRLKKAHLKKDQRWGSN